MILKGEFDRLGKRQISLQPNKNIYDKFLLGWKIKLY